MLSAAAQRQAKLATKAKARKQRLAVWTKRDEAEWRRLHNAAAVLVVIIDKREELYGQGDAGGWEYTDEQVAHVDAIVDAYTPEEFAAALAQANALDWEPDHIDEDWYERRVEQRRQQMRTGGVAPGFPCSSTDYPQGGVLTSAGTEYPRRGWERPVERRFRSAVLQALQRRQ